MGLAIEVGYLADMLANDEEGATRFRENMETLNAQLKLSGLRVHNEPESCPIFSAEMFGYSGLHYLRRLAAHLNIRGKLPEPGDGEASKDPVLEEYYGMVEKSGGSLFGRMFGKKPKEREYAHLIFHSDAEGFYVPQDFREVLFSDENLKIPGGMIGSSQRLLKEMEKLARAIDLPLELDPEAEEIWEAADSQGEGEKTWQRYGVESFTCLRLYHGAKHSVAHSAVIVFT
jgi:hypothetical protein